MFDRSCSVYVWVFSLERKPHGYLCATKNIECKNVDLRRAEQPLAHTKIHNALLSMIQSTDTSQAALEMVCVELPAGPFALSTMSEEGVAYFPMGAIISLGAPHSSQVPAVVGCHACLLPMPIEAGVLQADVMVPGHALRVDWRPVREDPQRYGAWLWATTSATQALIRQMALWALCAGQHTPTQVVASWLLTCGMQSSQTDLRLNWMALPPAVRLAIQGMQASPTDMPLLQSVEVIDGVLQASDWLQLRTLACSCHQHMAVQTAMAPPQ